MRKGYLSVYIKTIIILAVVVAIIVGGVNYFKDKYDDEQYETIKTNMLSIEGKTKIIGEKVKIKENDTTYVGKEIADFLEDEDIKALQEKEVIDIENENNKYYVLEKADLESLELTNIEEKGYYIVEYSNNEIIYAKGIKDKEGNVKYKLSELKQTNQEENKEEVKEENQDNGESNNKESNN